MLDAATCERARLARDARFDGRFFVAVVTTGIYCRPVCPVQPPAAAHVRFYGSAPAAARAGFRPCLRCRPETAPGSPAWFGTPATVRRALRLIDAGALDAGGADDLAQRLGVGARHLRRLFDRHIGAPPQQVAATCRLHRAKRLLDATDLSVAAVAQAAGFGSVRRFNDVIRRTYGCAPRDLRGRKRRSQPTAGSDGALRLRLRYRPPYDAAALLAFLAPRAVPGLEAVDVARRTYRRTFRLSGDVRADGSGEAARTAQPAAGVVRLEAGRAGYLNAEVCHPDARVLLDVTARLRRLFDLDADPVSFRQRLAGPGPLHARLSALPGIRVPGAWDGFELAVRAILGQQVTVRGATTLAGRLVEALGERLPEPLRGPGLTWTFPPPAAVAGFDLRTIGVPTARATALRTVAAAVATGRLDLDATADPDAVRAQLSAIAGIGPWTTEYIAMRALRDPDAFPAGDLGLRRAVAGPAPTVRPRSNAARRDASPLECRDDFRHGPPAPISARELHAMAEPWRPWRAYAAMLLWQDTPANHPEGRDAQVVP